MPSSDRSLLTVWNDWTGDEDEYADWYDREHIPQRLSFPGFSEAARYEAVDADREYFTAYKLSSLAALQHQAYQHCLDSPTPRTKNNLPNFRGMIRAGFDLASSSGCGAGGFVVCARRDAGEAPEVDVDTWVGRPGVLSLQEWKASIENPIKPSSEAHRRGGADGTASALILLECVGEKHALAAAKALAASENLQDVRIGVYRFLSRIVST